MLLINSTNEKKKTRYSKEKGESCAKKVAATKKKVSVKKKVVKKKAAPKEKKVLCAPDGFVYVCLAWYNGMIHISTLTKVFTYANNEFKPVDLAMTRQTVAITFLPVPVCYGQLAQPTPCNLMAGNGRG